ncbi:MAG TPA: ABC transporter ATP-binding protein [Acidobacteria bacterium]|nr:ABC transporter ATP-binding protein [Acidobacteriota bacterium]
MAETKVAVETEGLVRSFGELRAVDGLDLSVARGSFFGFLGPNGAGKSTTLKILTGLLEPTAGTARILGFDVVRNPREAKALIGVVPEELMLFDRLSGTEYLELVGRLYGMPRVEIASRSEELLDVLGLADAGSRLIVDYSHGMQKKLSLAAAILHDPEVLFLDEPFEGIDAVAARLIKNILNRLRDRGVTVFLTSHILEIVERLCTDIAIIDHGRLVAHGTLEELRRGVPARNGRPSTLEELFLSLVGGEEINGGELSWIE